MKRLFTCALSLFLAAGTIGITASAALLRAAGQSAASSTVGAEAASTSRRRGPVFRANKEQITQAQTALKRGGHYGGEATGKLDPETRGALKKYQAAAGLKETGTLNRATLEKMGIALTEKQKAM